MHDDLKTIFSQNGLLASEITNYLPRDAQLQMAIKVSDTLNNMGTLVCEAGTGTGKTFAYLIPAILSGKPVLISTGTKNLQDQLYYKDLPVIARVLKPLIQRKIKVSVLKGRANYVCLHRFRKVSNEGWYDEQTQADLEIVRQSLKQTKFADISEFMQLKEQSSIWPMITSTSENCLGASCLKHEDCYVLKARQQAFDADVIIVNHHLLMADLKLKNDALGELLPPVQAYIIDEAHQLPEIVSRFVSRNISSRQIKELLKDIQRTITHSPKKKFMTLSTEVRKMLDDLIVVLRRYRQSGSWTEIRNDINPLIAEVLNVLKQLNKLLKPMATETAELENCARRCEQLCLDFELLTGTTPAQMIHWFECHKNSFEIHLTPLSVGKAFKQLMDNHYSSWVFTSATLAVKLPTMFNSQLSDTIVLDEQGRINKLKEPGEADFHYFSSQLALTQFDSLLLESPFDYKQQAILFAPQNLPLPGDSHYIASLIHSIIPIVEFLEGRTFFLFTSYRAMQEARDLLSGMDFHLLVQGDAPKQQLINEFKSTSRAILLGTSSFWEGVDVKGEALSCVIIDKLPFASPHEPVMQARINHLQQQGINAFYQYQLPQAAMSLKQGAGRLIRDVYDRGILVIADPRFYLKSYGHYLRQCLPEMAVETNLEQLIKYIKQL